MDSPLFLNRIGKPAFIKKKDTKSTLSWSAYVDAWRESCIGQFFTCR